MKRNTILVLSSIVIISFFAILRYKNSHANPVSDSSQVHDDVTSHSSVSVSRNNMRKREATDNWSKEWIKAFSTPEIAHAMLNERIKIQSIEQIMSRVDDETLLNYFLHQKANDDDAINWQLYVAFMRRSLDTDPKNFVKVLNQLKRDPGDSMVEDATALILMRNQATDAPDVEVLMEYFTGAVNFSGGYPFFKKFTDSGYTYTKSLELLYEFYPLAAKFVMTRFFTGETYEPISRRDKSMILSTSEKENLIQFIQKNYKNDDMSDMLTAIQELKVE